MISSPFLINTARSLISSYPETEVIRTGDSRGFAFVRYKYADEAQKAVERLDGRNVDGRDIMVQFAKYGPNAEPIRKGRIVEKVSRTRGRSRSCSPRPRYRDDYWDRDYRRRDRDRSRERYNRDSYRGRGTDYYRRSRSLSVSSDYYRGRIRDSHYDARRRSRSRSFNSASPYRHSPSPIRSSAPHRAPSSRGESPIRRNGDERSATPNSVSPPARSADSWSPSPRNSDADD